MTRLYGYLAAIGGLIMAVLTFGAYQRRKGVIGEREKTAKKTSEANAAARERIDNAIRPDDTSDAARDRLVKRNNKK